MGYHDVQQVCLNGHQTTANYNRSPEFRKSYCPECGEETIHQCPECNHPIKGEYHVEGVISIGHITSVPTHCENCGTPYPWTQRKAEISKTLSTSDGVDPFFIVSLLCSRFHLVAKQIKARYSDRDTLVVNDEYDAQDLLHSLLHIYFDDIRPEEWSPSYAGGCSRVDFLLKHEKIVIEVKKLENR